ncbi:MAG: peroxidase [Planctomycetaceae bacterium]|nr:peroxidase [Planctomycetaceae bacterium]
MAISWFRSARRQRSSSPWQAVIRQCENVEERLLLSAASVDGSGNNLTNPEWGSAGEDLLRIADAQYPDGIAEVAGTNRPSARAISNDVSDSGGNDIISQRLLSAMIYAWGQFLDHDITLTKTGDGETTTIEIPEGDPWFDPQFTGTQSITMLRSAFNPLTGDDVVNPRQQFNSISAFIDGSMIYGSDPQTAGSLRTYENGLLKTSGDNLLPTNSVEVFPEGPLPMDNANPFVSSEQLFAAGDARANENIELIALQTLFVREHNYQAGQIAQKAPSLSDEEIYQQARSIVIGEIQAITYNEWLPSLLGPGAMTRYDGYDPLVNPGISNEFATAAFRFGHSQLGDDIEFLDNDGMESREAVSLSHAFFNPDLIRETGIDPVLKYLASDPSGEVDTEIVDSVRNFLFGPPGAGGLDLAALNIQRGRDHGLADYNSVREAVGLPRVQSFSEITSDIGLQQKLENLYGDVDNVDLWVGGLAEDHISGSSLGETFQTIIVDQFERLRAGDRHWYQNQFSGRLLNQINRTSLSEIIERNTQLTNLQNNTFFFRASISGTVAHAGNAGGRRVLNERPVASAIVQLINAESGELTASTVTNRNGQYRFAVEDGLRTGEYQIVIVDDDGTVLTESRVISIQSGEDFERANLTIRSAHPVNHPHPANQPRSGRQRGSASGANPAQTPLARGSKAMKSDSSEAGPADRNKVCESTLDTNHTMQSAKNRSVVAQSADLRVMLSEEDSAGRSPSGGLELLDQVFGQGLPDLLA